MKWNIIADTACDLYNKDINNENINFETIPFSIRIGNEEIIDDESLDVNSLIEKMDASKEPAKTSCPSTGDWYDRFSKDGNVIAVTITSKLSGSYNSAIAAKNMILEDDPNKNIVVLDSKSTGAEIILIIDRIVELIESGLEFDDVVKEISEFMKKTKVVFALSSFNNLVKNGRMSSTSALIARLLGFVGIGIARDGEIVMKTKARGKRHLIEKIIDDIKERGFATKKIIIDHCQNLNLAQMLEEKIKSIWSDVKVIIKSTRGLCTIYAEKGGLIVGY